MEPEEQTEWKKKLNAVGKVHRVPYDSTNCIRFNGFVLSPEYTEHPNRTSFFYQ